MEEIKSLKEVQDVELSILDNVTKYCEKNNLRYFLAGGTLLGAVRHKGFIPWDNDIDISMPREDYSSFIANYKSEDERFVIIHPSTSSDYYDPSAKVVDKKTFLVEKNREIAVKDLGIYIDIFPIDGFGNDKNKARKTLLHYWKKAHSILHYKGPMNTLTNKGKVKRLFYRAILPIIGKEKAFQRLERHLREISFDNSEYIGSTFGSKIEDEIIDHSVFSDFIMLEFEQRLFRAPKGYDEYLTQMYGDYMKLPPESERIVPHDVEIFWR